MYPSRRMRSTRPTSQAIMMLDKHTLSVPPSAKFVIKVIVASVLL